jgi:hypothetical protein
LESIEFHSRQEELKRDIMFISLLASSDLGVMTRLCNSLQNLKVSDGILRFLAIIHRIFMEHNMPLQDEQLPLIALLDCMEFFGHIIAED